MRFDVKRLRLRCEQSIESIISDAGKLGEVSRLDTEDGPLVWVKRGSPVLGCVHLDFVPVAHRWGYDRKRERVYTARLDDRMGVFILLDVLPALGINLDLLLTDSEERGASTAKRYVDWITREGGPTRIEYNWLAQFDRRGDDAATYDYDRSEEWEKALKAGGFKLSRGSFSDIAALYDLGVCGINIGVGYHGEHSVGCYGDLAETAANLAKFRQFYSVNHARKFEFTAEMRDRYSYQGGGYQYWQGSFYGTARRSSQVDDYGIGFARSSVRYYGHHAGKVADCDEVCRNCGDSVHWLDMGIEFCNECEWFAGIALDSFDDETASKEAAEYAEFLNRFEGID